MTADDRVNLAFGCELCQVAAKLFKCTAAFLFAVFVLRIRVAGSFIDGITVGKRRGQRIRNALRVNAEHLQETHRKAFTVFNDGDEQVLRADIVTAKLEAASFAICKMRFVRGVKYAVVRFVGEEVPIFSCIRRS